MENKQVELTKKLANELTTDSYTRENLTIAREALKSIVWLYGTRNESREIHVIACNALTKIEWEVE